MSTQNTQDLTQPTLVNLSKVLKLAVSVFLFLLPAISTAEEPAEEVTEQTEQLEIIGDRPDFTESSAAIPPRHLQGELGVAYSTIGDENVLTVPNLLLRIGIVEHLEVRLGLPSFTAFFIDGNTFPDASGAELGMKAAFDVGDAGALGILPYAVFPVYREAWEGEGLELGIKGLWSVDLGTFFSLGGNLGVIFTGVTPSNADFTPHYLASLSLGLSLFGWFGTYVEVYGFLTNDLDVISVADGGFTFLVAPWLQLDVHAGAGLNPDARGFDVGAGAVFLI